MRLTYSLKTAFQGLATNKLRSILTILGIVIGITAIILVMSIGQGAEELILDQVRGLGAQTVVVEPGREPRGPSDFSEFFTDSLKEKDIEALRKKVNAPGIKEIAPLVALSATISYGNESVRSSMRGASELIGEILDIIPNRGDFFTEEDIKQSASVAVIGSEVEEKLFGNNDALGQKIKIKNKTFRIVGIIPKKGGGLIDVDNMVFVPYTTAQKYLLGINYYHAVMVQAEPTADIDEVARDIKLTLRESHGITDPEKDDFHVTTQADVIQRIGLISNVLTILLVSVAAISLVVGGIGIMNIMLVSVTERTREVGLRKALGATEKNILTQFLIESVMLTCVGGIIGISLGALFALLTKIILTQVVKIQWVFSFPVSGALLGLGVSGIVGLVFGLYPARRASKLSPIEALRYE